MACNEDNGIECDTSQSDPSCKSWQLTNTNSQEFCYMNSIAIEELNIAGANVNVFPLLGIHEQGALVDLVGNGSSISSGDGNPVYSSANAFTAYIDEWRSSQRGQDVVDNSYIGYDFGEIILDNLRKQYGIETFVRHNIATIKIKQGNQSKNRITRARIERSDDGEKWYGAAIITLPDSNILAEINFKHTTPSRYWRIRPLDFNGGIGDYWTVQAIEMMDYDLTSIDDIQDEIFQENRDRDYASESVLIKASYDLLDAQTELTVFGIELPSQQFYLKMNFSAVVNALGRPMVIGDILELPSEIQYDFNMQKVKKYLEVNDVAWDSQSFTPGWQPINIRVIAQPMMASAETMDVFEGLNEEIDDTGLAQYGLKALEGVNEHSVFQDYSTETQLLAGVSNSQNPELGADTSDLRQFSNDEIDRAVDQGLNALNKLNVNPRALYIEDGLPPNGLDFTTGDSLPDISTAKDGDFHRLTYDGIGKDIPARLFRFSVVKNRWLFQESDKRAEYNPIKPKLNEYYNARNNPTSNEDI